MPRFFVLPDAINDNQIKLDGADFNHLKKVLRVQIGDEITICDGQGMDFRCGISFIEKDCLHATILSAYKNDTEPTNKITLFQAIPKADKMEWIIQKSVELGVHRIVPVRTCRSVINISQERAVKKAERWQKIAESAAKQCGRGLIPKIEPVCDFGEALELSHNLDATIMPYELEKQVSMQHFIDSIKDLNNNEKALGLGLGIFIGPEGGFSDEEAKQAKMHQLMLVSLGKRILRTETAGCYALTILLYLLEQ